MADRIRITELDFDLIKENLKSFLKQQDTFTDYDFDGAGLSILLDILAYNTHYNGYYLNMVANEAFLDTAMLRNSVVSHAKLLGYIPTSKKTSVATINLDVISTNSNIGTLTVPRGFNFLSNKIDGKSYNFVILEDVTVTKANTEYNFENLLISEGQLVTYKYVHDESDNPKQVFTLPDENIDVSSLIVTVSPTVMSNDVVIYPRSDDITDVDSTSEIYYLQESNNGKYQIYFGNDILGKKLPDGALLTTSYLITNGTLANGANNFIVAGTLTDSLSESLSNFVITPVIHADGGAEREEIDSIKYSAPLQYLSQNRVVSIKDYELFIKKNYPNIDSISVWGGEDEVPPVYGKVFASLKPKDNYYISETEKLRIINDILRNRSVVSISTEIRDPEFLYIICDIITEYDPKRTTLTKEGLKNEIRSVVNSYKNSYLNKFSTKFISSKLQELINDISRNSIVGSELSIKVQKRFLPTLSKIANYTISFNVELTQGEASKKLTSTEFSVYDSNGILRKVTIEEIPKSTTGINAIDVIDSGTGYTSTPTVTITGDGYGATASAIIKNGKIESIQILNSGIDYNRAVVTITGGGGHGATALAIIDTKIGNLRVVYYNDKAERQIVNANVGQINYADGIIYLNDLNVINVIPSDGYIRINCLTKSGIIQSVRNTILTIDMDDPISILTNIESL